MMVKISGFMMAVDVGMETQRVSGCEREEQLTMRQQIEFWANVQAACGTCALRSKHIHCMLVLAACAVHLCAYAWKPEFVGK